jgi:hypothetical protein
MTSGRYPDWIADAVRELRACEMYHCTPSELDEEDWHTVTRHMAIKAAEQKYLDAEAKSQARRHGR